MWTSVLWWALSLAAIIVGSAFVVGTLHGLRHQNTAEKPSAENAAETPLKIPLRVTNAQVDMEFPNELSDEERQWIMDRVAAAVQHRLPTQDHYLLYYRDTGRLEMQ